jgi:hypothetical protein
VVRLSPAATGTCVQGVNSLTLERIVSRILNSPPSLGLITQGERRGPCPVGGDFSLFRESLRERCTYLDHVPEQIRPALEAIVLEAQIKDPLNGSFSGWRSAREAAWCFVARAFYGCAAELCQCVERGELPYLNLRATLEWLRDAIARDAFDRARLSEWARYQVGHDREALTLDAFTRDARERIEQTPRWRIVALKQIELLKKSRASSAAVDISNLDREFVALAQLAQANDKDRAEGHANDGLSMAEVSSFFPTLVAPPQVVLDPEAEREQQAAAVSASLNTLTKAPPPPTTLGRPLGGYVHYPPRPPNPVRTGPGLVIGPEPRDEEAAATIARRGEPTQLPAEQVFRRTRRSEEVSAEWSDIIIEFISESRVQISVKHLSYPVNYAEMGFEDRRTEKPTLAWETLSELAAAEGTLAPISRGGRRSPERPAGGQRQVQERQSEPLSRLQDLGKPLAKRSKRIEEVRRGLRAYFEGQNITLDGAPDPLPYVRGVGYRACFKIRRRMAFEV